MIEEKQIFTLKQVSLSIQRLMNERYAQKYWVKAEIFKLNLTNKGHCFPELVHKENGTIVTEMRGTIWATNFKKISENFANVVKEPITDGMELLLLVKISFHPIYGLSLEIHDIDPTFSLGELQKEREETLNKLKKLGVLNKNQNLTFPLIPKRLAIISVASSKGFMDFCTIIKNNPKKYKFVYKLFEANLNGDLAIPSITTALQKINENVHEFDAVLIIRGGGGEIGLSCYNNFNLSLEIANFPLPILTGIGHSTNNTVSEMIAFQSFITPTELADFLLTCFDEFNFQLIKSLSFIQQELKKILKHEQNNLKLHITKFKYTSTHIIAKNTHKIEIQKDNLVRFSTECIKTQHAKIETLSNKIKSSLFSKTQGENYKLNYSIIHLKKYFAEQIKKEFLILEDSKFFILNKLPKFLEQKREIIIQTENKLQLIDPNTILKKGYSIVLTANKKLASPTNIKEGDSLEIISYQHTISSKILKIKKHD